MSALTELGFVEERTLFAGEILMYRLELGASESVSASFDGGTICVSLPRAMAKEWTTSETVGIDAVQNGLKILVEKDFECLNHEHEGQEDAFPNPSQGTPR